MNRRWIRNNKTVMTYYRILSVNYPLKLWKTSHPITLLIFEYTNLRIKVCNITSASIWKVLDNLWHQNILGVWIYVLCIFEISNIKLKILSRVRACVWFTRRVFDWITGFIDILYIQLGPTRNYTAIADLHTLQFTVRHTLEFSVYY
jgi:hypothetical protein